MLYLRYGLEIVRSFKVELPTTRSIWLSVHPAQPKSKKTLEMNTTFQVSSVSVYVQLGSLQNCKLVL